MRKTERQREVLLFDRCQNIIQKHTKFIENDIPRNQDV